MSSYAIHHSRHVLTMDLTPHQIQCRLCQDTWPALGQSKCDIAFLYPFVCFACSQVCWTPYLIVLWSARGPHSSAKVVDPLLPSQNLVQQALDASFHIPPSAPPISFSEQPVLPASSPSQPFFALSQLASTSAYP